MEKKLIDTKLSRKSKDLQSDNDYEEKMVVYVCAPNELFLPLNVFSIPP
jgi:hypothetical protein